MGGSLACVRLYFPVCKHDISVGCNAVSDVLSTQLPWITFLQELTSTSHLRLGEVLNKAVAFGSSLALYALYMHSRAPPVPDKLFCYHVSKHCAVWVLTSGPVPTHRCLSWSAVMLKPQNVRQNSSCQCVWRLLLNSTSFYQKSVLTVDDLNLKYVVFCRQLSQTSNLDAIPQLWFHCWQSFNKTTCSTFICVYSLFKLGVFHFWKMLFEDLFATLYFTVIFLSFSRYCVWLCVVPVFLFFLILCLSPSPCLAAQVCVVG